MPFMHYVRLDSHQRMILFRNGEPKAMFGEGRHLVVRWGFGYHVETYSTREPWNLPSDLELLIKSEVATQDLEVIRLGEHERALVWLDGRVDRALGAGAHALWKAFYEVHVNRLDPDAVELKHPRLRQVLESELLADEVLPLDLNDLQRALVWVDGRLDRVLGPGLHGLWQAPHRLRTEVIETGDGLLRHDQARLAVSATQAQAHLERVEVATEHVGIYYRDGVMIGHLGPGVHGLWREPGRGQVFHVDLREQTLEVSGQEIITADKVSLRLNATVVFKVEDPELMLRSVQDPNQALYRDAQLTLRAVIGTRELDPLLAEKEALGGEWRELLAPKAAELGLKLVLVGIKDLILPGEMRVLMNRVTEARKAAEANLIARREETAAMRSQANTARILEQSPTLMKLRELEVLEKVAEKSQLQVILGETGLSDRLTRLI